LLHRYIYLCYHATTKNPLTLPPAIAAQLNDLGVDALTAVEFYLSSNLVRDARVLALVQSGRTRASIAADMGLSLIRVQQIIAAQKVKNGITKRLTNYRK
jgi:hypothetical protein